MSTIGFIGLGAMRSRIAGQEKHIRLARGATDRLEISLPWATVADMMLAGERQLGYAHRDPAALPDVLARSRAA
jgi:hypothetical protein